jgi:hypothetical protein
VVDFLLAWFDDDIAHAETIADDILAAWPRDLLILKLRQYHASIAAISRHAPRRLQRRPANPDDPTCTA